jgi:nitrogen fixation protein NifU and related proteins
MDDLSDLYQQVILDHCKHPRNFGEMAQPTCTAQGHNPLCGDQLTVVSANGENDRIREIRFTGSGCCISKASASLLTESLKDKAPAEVRALFELVHDMVTTGKSVDNIGKLAVFAGVYKFPARVKCAILPWHAVLAALDGKQEPVTTEREDT